MYMIGDINESVRVIYISSVSLRSSALYKRFLYISGNFRKSLSYIRQVKAGKSYKKYKLTERNCAWMAIQVLKMGYSKKSSMYKKLHGIQYRYVPYNKTSYMITIIPRDALKKLEGIYHKKSQAVVGA